jgi:dextranase
MRLVDFYPVQGTFAPGDKVILIAEVEAEAHAPATLRLSITHLASTVATLTQPVSLAPGNRKVTLDWPAPPSAPRGYGAQAELLDDAGQVLASVSTAFDVLPDWTAFPRYGFLTDFSPDRTDAASTVEALARFHLNGLQFYDWQYRHDRLLPPNTDYVDPLGRRLSLRIVEEFIEAAHAHGMAAMPYLAVYAASAEFWRAHPEWALYDAGRRPIPFGENFLGLMNPIADGPWMRHLLAECGRVLATLPFDGLHVDQYGNPKVAFDAAGQPVDLPAAFAGFVAALKGVHPRATVLFNAVGNWPIETLVVSPQAFAYIEVWPPAISYRDLRQIVTGARAMSKGKPVVIALYLAADRPANIRLADALIFSCGGSRIELGERERLLADPYFPKHQALTSELKVALRRYYDFAVRYGDLIGPGAADSTEYPAHVPQGVWAVSRIARGWLTVCLINMTGLDGGRWDEAHPAPAPVADVPVRVVAPRPVHRVWWASPDRDPLELTPAAWDSEAQDVRATLPFLDYWAILAFQLDATE